MPDFIIIDIELLRQVFSMLPDLHEISQFSLDRICLLHGMYSGDWFAFKFDEAAKRRISHKKLNWHIVKAKGYNN